MSNNETLYQHCSPDKDTVDTSVYKSAATKQLKMLKLSPQTRKIAYGTIFNFVQEALKLG